MYITYIMYTYSTLYLRVYQVHIWPRLPPFDGGCVSWSFSIAAVYYLVLGLVTYLAHGSLAENRLKETVGSCTAQLLIQSGLGAINGWFHTIDTQLDHGLYFQIFGGPVFLRRVAGDDLHPVFTKDMSNLAADAEIVLRGRLTTTISTGPHGVTITKG